MPVNVIKIMRWSRGLLENSDGFNGWKSCVQLLLNNEEWDIFKRGVNVHNLSLNVFTHRWNNKIYGQRLSPQNNCYLFYKWLCHVNSKFYSKTHFLHFETTLILDPALLLVQTYPSFKRSFTVAHILSTLMRHLFGKRSHSTFIRGFKQTCLFLLNRCADSLWEAKCHSENFTQPWKVKAINALTSFDSIKSFAWKGHPRGTTLTLKNQHIVPVLPGSSDYIG